MFLVGILLTLFLFFLSFFVSIIKWPFDRIKMFSYKHPLRTARFVIGAAASCLLAFLFDASFIVEVTYGGAFGSVLLGEIL